MPIKAMTIMAIEIAPELRISWLAELRALSRFLFPRYWAVITAPPVARAAKILIKRTLIVSTRETPETALSPAADTMIISAIPTATAKNCSIISGTINLFKSFLENINSIRQPSCYFITWRISNVPIIQGIKTPCIIKKLSPQNMNVIYFI